LILIDARGHGDNDKPEVAEAYQWESMVKDIGTMLDNLGLQRAIYLGYSSGGSVGFGLGRLAPERVSALIIGGTSPYCPADDRAGRMAFANEQSQSLQNQTTEDFVTGLEKYISSINLPSLSPQMHAALLKHNPKALIAWLRASNDWPSFENSLSRMTMPCLLYCGEYDGPEEVQRAAEEMPNAKFVCIPGGEHLEGGTWIKILRSEILALASRQLFAD
jgi:pimeloyl-ACP methyl ester carboxylesterase